MRICRVATVPFLFLHHLQSQIKATVEAGHEVCLISSPSSNFGTSADSELSIAGAHHQAIEIPRNVSPLADLLALFALYRFFRSSRFDVVHSVSSKAGFLCAIAALFAGVPIRLHTFIGQPWAGLSGPMRWVSKACDWLIARLDTQCYADSESQRAYLISEGIAGREHIKTLGAGSVAGVDLARFNPARFDKQAVRTELALPADAHVIIFIGRINREKGIVELAAAMDMLVKRGFYNVVLLIVGPFESDRFSLPEETQNSLKQAHFRVLGYVDAPEKYLAASDLFCLPSYREGFGSVVIEAAAMGIPTVATRVVGLRDSVVEDTTGLLVPPRDPESLANALALVLGDSKLRCKLGLAAQARARTSFNSESVNRLVLNEYINLFKSNAISRTPPGGQVS